MQQIKGSSLFLFEKYFNDNESIRIVKTLSLNLRTIVYENCEMAIAISSYRAASASVPGVAFKCLHQGQCSDWLKAIKWI